MFYAHIREDGRKQTVEEHLQGTAALCGQFAARFSEEERGALLGYAHDIGKTSLAFQKRLENGPKVDHSTAGALECALRGELLAACCVAGHHGGLPDFGNMKADPAGAPTLAGRLKKGRQGQIPEYNWRGELPPAGKMPAFQDAFTYALWTRMLYSCLVDADYLDTEAFMQDDAPDRGDYDALTTLLERLDAYIRPWFPAKTELNRYRCEILEQCIHAAKGPRGIYSLTVPTGGGKTVASLAFALRHAVEHGLDRVIYVIPYTSIIEQNAAVFREILGEANVVEHHSGMDLDGEGETSRKNLCQRLAAENWDAPVIVTTAVQFFESLYSNRPSRCRKLHNICNSVVIFDEAQMLPACHLDPCAGVIANLAAHFRTTALLCTATQPVLDDILRSFCPDLKIREICPGTAAVYEKLRRVSYRNGGMLTKEELCGELTEQKQVLCILNTRKAAQRVFEGLPEEGRFHLSTLMYPDHRREVLSAIRERLRTGQVCRVVSTSLIEAGVDVDFPAVYREIAGLDSIAQAAGRCNREGKRLAETSLVTYFQGEDAAPALQRINIGAAREALAGGGDPGNPETIQRYFRAWRSLQGNQLDKSETVKHLRNGFRGCIFPFETVAGNFHFIDQAGCTVYIPQGNGAELCRKILEGTADKREYRQAGKYSVSIFEQHFRWLLAAGDIQPVGEDSAVLTNLQRYSRNTGLALQTEMGKAEFV